MLYIPRRCPPTFVLDLTEPLSPMINNNGDRYRLSNGATVSHVLYMDDIKMYTKNERDIDSLIHLTRIYSNNITMSFRLDKFGRMVSTRGKIRIATSTWGSHRQIATIRRQHGGQLQPSTYRECSRS